MENKGCYAGSTVPDPPDSMKTHPLNREEVEECYICNGEGDIIKVDDEGITICIKCYACNGTGRA